ncbi:MAG: hypothetical protein IKH77_05920 [Clostridia bacterium]|nr:hypothetical protein [Clostridia bacterium]
MKTAVIGIGSNSVRMLLAEVRGSSGLRLRRDRTVTRLFAGLGPDQCLSPEAMAKTAAEVARMAADARAAGAGEILVFATSATRDAANRDVFGALIREAAGVPLQVCSGREEALQSYLGACDGGRCGVIDIGGGSTEVVSGDAGQPAASFSCQMGAVRLYQALPIRSAADLPLAIGRAEAVIGEALARCEGWQAPETWWGTGGTFTCLGALVNGTHWSDRACLHGTRVTREAARDLACRLADMPLAERMALPSLHAGRADIVVHGISILLACMQLLDMPALRVSEYGNLEGCLKQHYRLTVLDSAPDM